MNNFICFTRIENVRTGGYMPLTPKECETIVRKDDISKIIHVPFSAGDTFNPGHSEGYELHTKSGDIFKISERMFNNFKNLIFTESMNRLVAEKRSVCNRATTTSPSEQIAPEDDSPTEKSKPQTLFERRLVDLDFSVRSLCCFKAMGLETVGDLVNMTKQELLRTRNFGKRSLEEVEDFLSKYNLKLKDS